MEIVQPTNSGGSGGSETLAQVSANSLTQPDSTYTIPTDIGVIFNSTDLNPSIAQVNITADGQGALELLNYGPGDQEIHFDVNWIGNTYIAQNTTIAMIAELGDGIQFFASDGQTIGNPTTSDFNFPKARIAPNGGFFAGMTSDGRLGLSIDPSNNEYGIGDLNNINHQTWVTVNDDDSLITVHGNTGSGFSGITFRGTGLNDFSLSGVFTATGPATFSVTIDSVNNASITYLSETGLFNPGDIIDNTVSGGTTTGTVVSDDGAGNLVVTGITGGIFNLGDILTDQTTSDTLTIDTITIQPDTFSWVETGGTGGSGSLIPVSPTLILLIDGISVSWTSSFTGHVLNDNWSWSYSFIAGTMETFDGVNHIITTGDVSGLQTGAVTNLSWTLNNSFWEFSIPSTGALPIAANSNGNVVLGDYLVDVFSGLGIHVDQDNNILYLGSDGTVVSSNNTKLAVDDANSRNYFVNQLTGGMGSDITGANVLSLPSNGNVFHVSGSPIIGNINGITLGNHLDGHRLQLIFQSTYTISNNISPVFGTTRRIFTPSGSPISVCPAGIPTTIVDITLDLANKNAWLITNVTYLAN